MADDERDLPPGVRDVLARLPREMRRRVLADYESHYAPFLSLLAGWKGAVQEHYLQSEAASLARLEEQFFPLGSWHFPAQALAIPQRPAHRRDRVRHGPHRFREQPVDRRRRRLASADFAPGSARAMGRTRLPRLAGHRVSCDRAD